MQLGRRASPPRSRRGGHAPLSHQELARTAAKALFAATAASGCPYRDCLLSVRNRRFWNRPGLKNFWWDFWGVELLFADWLARARAHFAECAAADRDQCNVRLSGRRNQLSSVSQKSILPFYLKKRVSVILHWSTFPSHWRRALNSQSITL